MRSDSRVMTLKVIGTGETMGYLATVSFLVAYLLNMADVGRDVQTALNLLGAGMAATYLYRKHAVPAVVSNIAWGLITLAGVAFR